MATIGDPTQNLPTPFGGTGEWSQITQSGAGKFPNPFWDIASEYVPRNLQQVFEWAEYIYLTYGTYRSAARKVVRYFLTELVLEGGNQDEVEKYEELLNKKLHLLTQLSEIGDDYMCFHGDTAVVTKDGIYQIRDLEGKTVLTLSQGGVYRTAKFKAYGRQELFEVMFSDGRTVLATAEHQWPVATSTGDTINVPTTKLMGRRIRRTVASRPPKGDAFNEGVCHGFVFGDGSIYNKTRKTPKAVANFFGEKDSALKPYFVGRGCKPSGNAVLSKIHGLPAHYKQLPANDASAEYWYGFVCGFLAADGSVDTYGCTVLTQVSRSALETIVAQLPRLGMVAGPIREYDVHNTFDRADGSIYTHDGSVCVVTLLKQFMTVDDLIISSHIAKFNNNTVTTNYGKYLGVKHVRPTGIVDNVYCCVEPDTHTFVIGNGVLTGNCYGNVFVSVYFPFDRFLICPKCQTHYHIDTIAYKFQFKSLTFDAVCLKCDYQGTFDREDMRSPDTSRTKLIRWNPKRMRLRYHDISGEIEYFYELEPRFLDKIRNGNRFYLNKTPWSIIECAARTPLSDQPLYKFERDQLYHMHEATLAGLPIRGWAIPPILPNFKLAYYIQVLRRYDEAIALDYIIPFRILFPQQSQAAGQDPLQMLSMDVFISHMKDMVAAKRANATDIQITPFPIGYEMLGGEGRTLSPKDNIAQAMDELLNAIGYPAELYRGSLAIQAFPVALRLFEKTWGTLVDGYNDLVDWVLKKLSRYYGWAPIEGSLRSVTLADDIERKALQLQAAAGMDISKATAFRPLGIDFMEEQKKVVEEQKEIMKLQQEAMEEQEVSQIGTGDPNAQGGMPTGPGGSPGATPGDVSQQAKDIAYQLVVQTPETARRGQLIKIKQSNPTLHALVLQEMDTLRSQLASQGQTMMLQQMKTGAAHDDADKMPSPMMLGLLIANQVLDYSNKDMRKLAMAIKQSVPDLASAYLAADKHPTIQAFRYVYGKRMGWL